jgi:hypothetical protein
MPMRLLTSNDQGNDHPIQNLDTVREFVKRGEATVHSRLDSPRCTNAHRNEQ